MAGRAQPAGGGAGRDRQAHDPQPAEPLLRAAELGHKPPPDAVDPPFGEGGTGGHGGAAARAILEALSAAVILLDAHLLITAMNPAAEDLLGISTRRARGESLQKLVGDDADFRDILGRVGSTGDAYALEMRLGPNEVHAEERIIDCRVSRIDQPPAALLVEMTDATRRLKISRENALLTQHGAGRQMIRQLAHEIKNPLGGIRGAAQLLERQLDDAELREYTRVVISETDRLSGLVDTLLGPGGPPNKRPMNVHELIEHVIRLIEAENPETLAIRRDYDPGLPAIALDRDQMIQAFLNLARNAATALAGQGTICFRSRAVTNFTIGELRHRVIASIEIEDDGPGIPRELEDSIFYPLVTGRAEGTGLGLPVAQELISRHGGLVEFESRPGRTVFFVRIPLTQTDEGRRGRA